jgi:hypothetical protein
VATVSVSLHKENPTGCNNVSELLLFHIYIKLNMFRATHRPSSGAKNCTGSLWFFIRGRLLDVLPDNVQQLHVQQLPTYEKLEAASAVFGS